MMATLLVSAMQSLPQIRRCGWRGTRSADMRAAAERAGGKQIIHPDTEDVVLNTLVDVERRSRRIEWVHARARLEVKVFRLEGDVIQDRNFHAAAQDTTVPGWSKARAAECR